jgi:dipeptidyl aminopeptidase/acylaminoacyl peptidase
MRSLCLAALIVIALLAAGRPGPVDAEGETPFRIAYIDQAGSLCVADISTEARACLLEGTEAAEFRELAWSPDGTMIAVHRALVNDGTQDDDDVLVVAADGSDELPNGRPSPTVLFDDARTFGTPQWSSESTRVASLTEGEFGSKYISVAQLSDGSDRQIEIEDIIQVFGNDVLSWSPDHSSFAIAAIQSDAPEYTPALMLVDAANGTSSTVMEFDPGLAGGNLNSVSWSPDGGKILFTRVPSPPSLPWTGSNSEHWIVNRDGSGPLLLYDSPSATGPQMEARFSPDGNTVAFDGLDATGVPNIYLVGSGGTNIRQITSSTAGAIRPRWWPQADTHLLAFDGDTVTISVISSGSLVEIGEPRPLFFGNNYEWAPTFGVLPPNAVAPTPTVEPVPPSPPLAEATPVSPPLAAGTPSSGSGIIAPGTGSGGNTASRGAARSIVTLAAGVLAFAAGVGLLPRTRRA